MSKEGCIYKQQEESIDQNSTWKTESNHGKNGERGEDQYGDIQVDRTGNDREDLWPWMELRVEYRIHNVA